MTAPHPAVLIELANLDHSGEPGPDAMRAGPYEPRHQLVRVTAAGRTVPVTRRAKPTWHAPQHLRGTR